MIHRKRGQKNTARLVASGILLCIRIRRHSFFTAFCGGHSSSRSICVGGHRWFVGYTLFFFSASVIRRGGHGQDCVSPITQ